MLEKSIESYLLRKTKAKKGLCIKAVAAGWSGWPDRTILLPGGILFFVELKAPGKKPRKTQKAVHGILENLGFGVYSIDSKTQVEEVLRNYGF